jgi:hypothetical protein
VLLAGLQGEAVRRPAGVVHGHAHEPAGQMACQPFADRDVAGVRPAVEQGGTEALGRSHDDVGAELARGHEQGERQQVGGHRDQRPARSCRSGRLAQVADRARAPGVGQHHPEEVVLRQRLGDVDLDDLDTDRVGTRAQDVEGLWQGVAVDQDAGGPLLARDTAHDRDGLGDCRTLVEQRRVGSRQPREIADHGLEVDQRLESALADLRLVRRVGGVPRRILQHVAPDHRGCDGRMVAEADHRDGHDVPTGELVQLGARLGLGGGGGQVQLGGAPDAARDSGVGQLGQRRVADVGQRLGAVGVADTDVTGGELAGRGGSG